MIKSVSSTTELGHVFADSVQALLQQTKLTANQIHAIGSHGQTIRHVPNQTIPYTLQIGDPNIIAARTGITCVADFRRRDLALGGQAAPLAPAFHADQLRSNTENRWVLNIGGIANATLLPKNPNTAAIGFDTGPGNTLLNLWIKQHQQVDYDHHGKWARSGTIQPDLLTALLQEPYFQAPAPKSTGRELFNLSWLEQVLKHFPTLHAANIQATLTELTATSIATALQNQANDAHNVFICGGGIHNHYLIERLQHHLPHWQLHSTAAVGIDPDWMEAMAFAWLAQQTLHRKPGNLPSVTGARKPAVLGAIYLG